MSKWTPAYRAGYDAARRSRNSLSHSLMMRAHLSWLDRYLADDIDRTEDDCETEAWLDGWQDYAYR